MNENKKVIKENRPIDRKGVDLLTRRLAADGYTITSGPRTTGDGYYESSILGLEGIQIEVTE